jgi:hypothetical protein
MADTRTVVLTITSTANADGTDTVSIVPTVNGSNQEFWRHVQDARKGQEVPFAITCAGQMMAAHMEAAKAQGAAAQLKREGLH